MELDRKIPIKQISRHTLIISDLGREGVATPDGGLDYTLEGQNFLQSRKPIISGELHEGETVELPERPKRPLGY